MYLYRHWRAFTCPRMAVFVLGSYALMHHGIFKFTHTFPNVNSYKRFWHHPNYKLLGPIYSWFYLVRPIFWTYIFARLSFTLGVMVKRHWKGEDDPHYYQYYDTLYPDLLHDSDDMRYLNFRYTDNKVTPEPMTGYYPHDNMRYGSFLNKKYDNTFTDFSTSEKQTRGV